MFIFIAVFLNEHDLWKCALILEIVEVVGMEWEDLASILVIDGPLRNPARIEILVVVLPGNARIVQQVENRQVWKTTVGSLGTRNPTERCGRERVCAIRPGRSQDRREPAVAGGKVESQRIVIRQIGP